MTTTMSHVNCRPRSTLAGQIDRLDGILDGLGEALTEAVADAVKGAVRAAVADLVHRPERVRPATGAQTSPATPIWRERLRQLAGRAAARLHAALAWVAQKVRRAGTWVRSTAGPIRARAKSAGDRAVAVLITAAAYRAGVEHCWQRHRPALLAVAIVLLASVAWFLVGPFAACLACGGLAVALVFRARAGLIGRYPPGSRSPESPGDCVQQLSVGGQEYWI
jgi:hypothetical protein